MSAHLAAAALAAATAVGLNLPFGAWRASLRRLSWRWFAAIHLPIPAIVLVRLLLGLGWRWVPLLLAAAVAGQLLGPRLRRRAPADAAPD